MTIAESIKLEFVKCPANYGSGKDLLVIEGIPLISCPSCGESYFTAETLHEVERIKLHREGFAENKAGVRRSGSIMPALTSRSNRRR